MSKCINDHKASRMLTCTLYLQAATSSNPFPHISALDWLSSCVDSPNTQHTMGIAHVEAQMLSTTTARSSIANRILWAYQILRGLLSGFDWAAWVGHSCLNTSWWAFIQNFRSAAQALQMRQPTRTGSHRWLMNMWLRSATQYVTRSFASFRSKWTITDVVICSLEDSSLHLHPLQPQITTRIKNYISPLISIKVNWKSSSAMLSRCKVSSVRFLKHLYICRRKISSQTLILLRLDHRACN